MSLIDINGLNITYNEGTDNEVVALKDINLSIKPHEFIVVLGASGCGKTTLLNTLAGFILTENGEVKIGGANIEKPAPDRGVVFQENALMPWLSVFDNIALGLKFQGISLAEQKKIVTKTLSWVDLAGFEDHYIYELSGGMQQRVGIARALATDPKILLMDEPLGALDAITRQEIQKVILNVWKETQKTIFMITHSIEESLFMATKLIIMTPRPGKIHQIFEPKFSMRFLQGESAKKIKKESEFNELKNTIMEMIEETSL